MKTFKRICIKDYTLTDGKKTFTVKRGKEYITSPEKEGLVTLFSTYWISGIPVCIFAGEIPGPGESHVVPI